MAEALDQEILTRIADAQPLYHQLVLVVGPARSGKTRALLGLAAEHGWPFVNLNLTLSERLLELTMRHRARQVARIVGELAAEQPSDVCLLDNTEMLFHRELRQDPLRLLQGLARNRTVVATWRGHIAGDVLTYATPEHQEYRRVIKPEALLVNAAPKSHQTGTDESARAEEKRV